MGKIIDLVKGEANLKADIEKPISGFYFKINSSAINTVATSADSIELKMTEISSYLELIKLSCTYRDKSGTPTFHYNSQTLLSIAEFSQNEEGLINAQVNEAGTELQVYVPLNANGGALPFNNDETLEFVVDTSAITDSEETLTGSVWTLESPSLSPDFYQWSKMLVQQNETEKTFDVRKFEQIMLPLHFITASTVVTVIYTNGQVIRLTKEDLLCLGIATNDISYNVGGLVKSGFGRYAILALSEAKEVQIHRTSTSAFEIYGINYKLINDLKAVARNNESLVSTTDTELFIEASKKLNA
jgi:hypothetical protein